MPSPPRPSSDLQRARAAVARRAAMLAIAALGVALAACARDDVRSGGSDTAAGGGGAVDSSAAQGGVVDTAKAPAGTWTTELAATRLRQIGPPVSTGTLPVRQNGIAVPGTRFTMPGAEVDVFVFADAGARGQNVDRLDVSRLPATTPELRGVPGTLSTDGNLAALIYTSDAAMRDRIKYALTTHEGDGALSTGTTPQTAPGVKKSTSPAPAKGKKRH